MKFKHFPVAGKVSMTVDRLHGFGRQSVKPLLFAADPSGPGGHAGGQVHLRRELEETVAPFPGPRVCACRRAGERCPPATTRECSPALRTGEAAGGQTSQVDINLVFENGSWDITVLEIINAIKWINQSIIFSTKFFKM